MSQDEHISNEQIEQLLQQAGAGDAPSAERPAPPQQGASPAAAAPSAAATSTARPPADSPSSRPQTASDIEFLISQAEQALASVDDPVESELAGLSPFEFRDFAGAPATTEKATLDLLRDVELDVKIELGRAHMYLEDVLKLRSGSVVALDKLAGDPVDVYVNGRLVARGEVLVLNDNFCVRVAELLSGDEAGK